MYRLNFLKIETKNPKEYLKGLKNKFNVERFQKVEVGDIMQFRLPPEGVEFKIEYLGEMPEKFDIQERVLNIEIPHGAIIFTCEEIGEERSASETFRVEVLFTYAGIIKNEHEELVHTAAV